MITIAPILYRWDFKTNVLAGFFFFEFVLLFVVRRVRFIVAIRYSRVNVDRLSGMFMFLAVAF